MGAPEEALGLVPVAVAPAQQAAQHIGQAQLAGQALLLAEPGARLARLLDRVPVRSVEREPAERRMQLHLRGDVAYLLRKSERVGIRGLRLLVVRLGHLEVLTEGEQGEDRLALVRAAGELHRPLEVLASLRHVADATEHAAEDPVRAT